MATKPKLSDEEQVREYYHQLMHPQIEMIEALRNIVLASSSEIAEQIKWNSPSFYYTGEMKPFNPKEYKRDIVVFNLHKKEYVLLIFPTGASINDITGLLEGKFTDGRKTIQFSTLAQVKERASDLQKVIQLWLTQVEK